MDNLSLGIQSNRGLGSFLRSIFSRRKNNCGISESQELQGYLDSIKSTKQDLEGIQRFFNSTCDPDLIEYAIYEEYAIKLRFSYLVKKAKEKNIKSINFTML